MSAVESRPDADVHPPRRRHWIVLLYFYLSALVGLSFVITGTTMALFGVKDAALPELGLQRYEYESRPKQDAMDERRRAGVDRLLSGVIVAAVGGPVLVWHLKRGRRSGAGSD